MTAFWKRWLNIWALVVAAFGLVLAGAGWPATDGGARLAMEIMGGSGAFAGFDTDLRFAVALMGAVTLGWGLTSFVLFQALFALEARAVPYWRMVLGFALTWYVVDSAASVANGYPLNALSNTVFIVLLAIPLVASGALGVQRRSAPV